jgi:hypothetical protein
MSDKNIIILVFGLIAFILFINILKFIFNFFSNRKRYVEAYDIRKEVDTKIRPRLGSLEQKFQKESESGEEFGKYVYGLFKDDFKDKNQKIVEKEICKCCNAYESAECKEDFCLEGACKK